MLGYPSVIASLQMSAMNIVLVLTDQLTSRISVVVILAWPFHIKRDSNPDDRTMQWGWCDICGGYGFQSHTKAGHNLYCPLMRINSVNLYNSSSVLDVRNRAEPRNRWLEKESIFPLCISSVSLDVHLKQTSPCPEDKFTQVLNLQI